MYFPTISVVRQGLLKSTVVKVCLSLYNVTTLLLNSEGPLVEVDKVRVVTSCWCGHHAWFL